MWISSCDFFGFFNKIFLHLTFFVINKFQMSFIWIVSKTLKKVYVQLRSNNYVSFSPGSYIIIIIICIIIYIFLCFKRFSNLGNTCYMNAILQCLLNIEIFANELLVYYENQMRLIDKDPGLLITADECLYL